MNNLRDSPVALRVLAARAVGGGLAVLALLPTAYFAAGHQERRTLAAKDRHLASSGFPLLAPDLPGYVVKHPFASGRRFHYMLLPAGSDDRKAASSSISVNIYRLPSRFAPPERCNTNRQASVRELRKVRR